MNKLTEIGIKYGTDKAVYHKFTDFYFPWFENYIKPDILEIGIYQGASIRMLNEFFGGTNILSLDIVNKIDFGQPNIEVKLCDQSNTVELLSCTAGREFDIIIDDGSHIVQHQLVTLGTMFSKVKPGGIYIVEDIHTSFIPSYNPTGEYPNTYDVLYRMSKRLPIESRIIHEDIVQEIYRRVKGVHIFQRDTNLYTDSITAVIEF